MKDKLYKLNRTQKFYNLRRIVICSSVILFGTIIAAIPLSMNLVNNNKSTTVYNIRNFDVERKIDKTITIPEKILVLN
ncbi:MAG TPA: hypothetical protein DEA28_00550 [Firmicutes bacterium]|nr:hypothetical protein [Bacillota bacterium]